MSLLEELKLRNVFAARLWPGLVRMGSKTRGPGTGESRAGASSPIRNIILSYVRLLLRTFFRRIEVAGLENIPAEGGGVLICWHPNGWIDGAVITTHFPNSLAMSNIRTSWI